MIRSYFEIKFLNLCLQRDLMKEKHSCMAVWLGIFLKNEGGYEIVGDHWLTIKTITINRESPELKEAAAMFAPILQSQAQKRYPMVIEAQKN